MLLSLTLALGALLPGAQLAPTAPVEASFESSWLQDDEKPDKRPEIKALLDQLKGHTKKKGKEDEEAIATLDKLVTEYPESGPKDQKAIADAVAKCLKEKRKKELEPGVPDDRLHMATAVALGRMAPHSVKALIGSIDAKGLKDNLNLQRQLVLSLGKTKDKKAVKPLMELLKHHKPGMQSAGAEALGNFSEFPQKERKEITIELIKIMMGQKAVVDQNPTDQIERERWDIISGPIIESLRLVTGHDERDPDAWQRWWNKNKKADWEKLK